MDDFNVDHVGRYVAIHKFRVGIYFFVVDVNAKRATALILDG